MLGNKIVEEPKAQVDGVFIAVLGRGKKPLIQVRGPPESLVGGSGKQGALSLTFPVPASQGDTKKSPLTPSHLPTFPAVIPCDKRLLAK